MYTDDINFELYISDAERLIEDMPAEELIGLADSMGFADWSIQDLTIALANKLYQDRVQGILYDFEPNEDSEVK